MIRKLDPQIGIALGVMVISCLALYISVRQTTIMNEQTQLLVDQTKASAWPHLDVTINRSFDQSGIIDYAIYVNNKGTGPAIIEATRLKYEGKVFHTWSEVYELMMTPDSIMLSHSNSSLFGEVIESNGRIRLLGLKNNPKLMRYFFENADKVKMEVCYGSVFGDKWIVTRDGFRSGLKKQSKQLVETCNISESENFLE